MRTWLVTRWTAAALGSLLLASLVGPTLVAAATPTFGFTQSSPSPASVNYSDLVTFHGAYTCLNGPDASSLCSTSVTSQTATFAIRPSGGSAFSTVATVTTSFVFAGTSAGCVTICSRAFQVQWRAGRAGSATVPPGTYDVRLTTTLTASEVVLASALTLTREGSTTTYTGATSGDEGTALAVNATVTDVDMGLLSGTGLITPDVNLGDGTSLTFALYDATNTTLVSGPVSATVSAYGDVFAPDPLALPAAGTYTLRTTYLGNAFYGPSSDLDSVTANSVNQPPTITVPGPLSAEATSPAGVAVQFSVGATDPEDNPDPTPSCDWSSGATFPLGLTTVHCSVTDSGGLTATDSFAVTVADTTAPALGVTTPESAGSGGWFNALSNDADPGVTIDVTASDAVGVAALSCTDNGAPVAGLASSGGSFAVGDGHHAIACAASDSASNGSTAGLTLDVDQTPPSPPVMTGGGLVEGGTYPFGAVPAGPSGCSATDAGSGLASCTVTGYSILVGPQTVTASATDVAGNVSTSQLHYAVGPWTLVGFAKPVDMAGLNVEKAGHQVPLKFEVWAGTTQLTSPDVVTAFTETQVSCSLGATLLGPVPAPSKDGVRFANSGSFAVTWLSPDQPGTCWQVAVTTADGSSLSASFRLR